MDEKEMLREIIREKFGKDVTELTDSEWRELCIDLNMINTYKKYERDKDGN